MTVYQFSSQKKETGELRLLLQIGLPVNIIAQKKFTAK